VGDGHTPQPSSSTDGKANSANSAAKVDVTATEPKSREKPAPTSTALAITGTTNLSMIHTALYPFNYVEYRDLCNS
jgi:hypothetical protein